MLIEIPYSKCGTMIHYWLPTYFEWKKIEANFIFREDEKIDKS